MYNFIVYQLLLFLLQLYFEQNVYGECIVVRRIGRYI